MVHRMLWFSEEMHVNGIMGPFRECIDPKPSPEKRHQCTATKSKYPLGVYSRLLCNTCYSSTVRKTEHLLNVYIWPIPVYISEAKKISFVPSFFANKV